MSGWRIQHECLRKGDPCKTTSKRRQLDHLAQFWAYASHVPRIHASMAWLHYFNATSTNAAVAAW